MRIGTAAPTDEELAAVPHHLVGIVEPDAPWTLADFLARVHEAIDAIHARGRLPVLVGGAGQYVWALLEGWQPPAVPPNWELRALLQREAREHGIEAIHVRLAALDPASAERIGTTNERRLIRALEIVEATGEPIGPLPRVRAAVAVARRRPPVVAVRAQPPREPAGGGDVRHRPRRGDT